MSEKKPTLKAFMILSGLWIVVMILLVPGFSSYSQEELTSWSEPIAVSSRRPSSWFPDITVDRTGKVHVVWGSTIEVPLAVDSETTHSDYDVVMYTFSTDGQSWSEAIDVIAVDQEGGSQATRPSLLADDDGLLHLTFRRGKVQYSQAKIETGTDASTWLEPRQISTDNSGYYSDLVIDKTGVFHLVFTQNVPTSDCPLCFHVLYRRSDDGGLNWSSIKDISILPIGSAKPQILFTVTGSLHVVWEAGRGGGLGQLSKPTDVRYAASYDGGQNWSLPLQFVAPSGQAGNIAIGYDGEGNLIVVWFDVVEKSVYFQLSSDDGRSWSSPSAISDVYGFDARLDRYSMATDGTGVIHLVLVGKQEEKRGSLELLHLTWDPTDAAWSVPEIITSLKGDVPEWPRIAVSEDNSLHMVWFVRDKAHIFDSENGRYQVWYAQKSSSMLDSGPTAVPTPVPTTQLVATIPPTVEPTQPPSIQPIPTSTLITQINTEGIANESDALSIIAKGLIPALIFVAVAIAIVRLRKV